MNEYLESRILKDDLPNDIEEYFIFYFIFFFFSYRIDSIEVNKNHKIEITRVKSIFDLHKYKLMEELIPSGSGMTNTYIYEKNMNIKLDFMELVN